MRTCSIRATLHAAHTSQSQYSRMLGSRHMMLQSCMLSEVRVPGMAASIGCLHMLRDAATMLHSRASTDVIICHAGALDIAVVQLLQPPSDLQPLTLGHRTPKRSAGCYVVGHALFNPSSRFAPLLTHGNVAQVANNWANDCKLCWKPTATAE